MSIKLRSLVAVGLIAAVAGCATQPDKIPASYVSPLTYKDYDCDQLIMEMDHVSRRTGELHASLKKKADNDAAQMGIGLLLLWPTLFLLEGGDGPEATEYARLRGEYEALRTNVVGQKCEFDSLPPSPEEIIDSKKKEADVQESNPYET